MMEFEPGHWARVRQITRTKCTGKLRAQLALTGRVGDLPSTQKKGDRITLYFFCLFYQKIVCRRLPSIKYAVGLVMLHCFFSLGGTMRSTYTCVIISWDVKCQASEEWINRMGIHSLARGTNQPFYHILTEDGSSRYVAEGN